MSDRLHLGPYQEVIMKKRENDANSHLVKIVEASCGGHMIDAISGRSWDAVSCSGDGVPYTWGDARRQPYGVPSALAATEVTGVTKEGKVYA